MEATTKELAEHVETKKLMTLQDKAIEKYKAQAPNLVRSDLMKASGQVGLNKPYRAPIYQTYAECIQGLYKQGMLGFYKGNGFRVAHIFLYEHFRNSFMYKMDEGEEIYHRNSFIKDYIAACGAALVLHPLHFAEARYVLQNRLPNF